MSNSHIFSLVEVLLLLGIFGATVVWPGALFSLAMIEALEKSKRTRTPAQQLLVFVAVLLRTVATSMLLLFIIGSVIVTYYWGMQKVFVFWSFFWYVMVICLLAALFLSTVGGWSLILTRTVRKFQNWRGTASVEKIKKPLPEIA